MTLTELSYYVRKALPFVVLFGLVFLIFFYSIKLYLIFLEVNTKKGPYIKSNLARIPPVSIDEATSSGSINFVMDTIEGRPVTATEAANVYFIPDSPTRFGYREKIYLMAKTFGFDTEKTKHKLTNKTAVFEEDGKKLSIDISNFNFDYETDIATDSFETGSAQKSETEIINKATDFLKSTGRYPDELSKGKTTLTYLKYDKSMNEFVNVKKPFEAFAVEVDFFRPDRDGIPVVPPRFFNSQNYVILQFKDNEIKILKARVNYFETSSELFDVYPLKSAEEAWSNLVDGFGKIVAGRQGIEKVTIKSMKLAYYDPFTYQSYLHPVYVFLGDNDFVAYVGAVSDSYLLAK